MLRRVWGMILMMCDVEILRSIGHEFLVLDRVNFENKHSHKHANLICLACPCNPDPISSVPVTSLSTDSLIVFNCCRYDSCLHGST